MSNDTSGPARFTQQASTAEDLLKSQTVGLVQLSDFRKRRAEVLEQKEREAQEIFLEKPKAANNRYIFQYQQLLTIFFFVFDYK